VPDMERAVRIGQSRGDEEVAGHRDKFTVIPAA
jgi:hypothetical protein